MTKELFRKEAIRHRTRALFGDVILAAPLSSWVITGLLVTIVVGALALGVFGTIETSGGRIPVWQWLFGQVR